jgi:aerobic-type carbon monoxide dehydrogenase small subunit (CoxS/CutS family)
MGTEPRDRNHVSEGGEHSTPPTTMSEIFRIDICNSVPCPHDVLPPDPLSSLIGRKWPPFPAMAAHQTGRCRRTGHAPLQDAPRPGFLNGGRTGQTGPPSTPHRGGTTTPGSGNAADETRMTIRFLLNGEPQSVDAPPTTTLLDWLREQKGLTGTKEGCNEGDCGACTVMVTDDSGVPRAQRLHPFPAAASRSRRPHGGGDRRPRRQLHPVQEAMVEHHGSQCGFCTPGFIVSMATAHLNGRTDHDDQLAGNLCRCTGYAPIIRAAEAAAGQDRARLDEERCRKPKDDPPSSFPKYAPRDASPSRRRHRPTNSPPGMTRTPTPP